MAILGSGRRHPYFPIFEALLGPGLIHECMVWKDGREEFHIGWRFRRDRQVNPTLLRIYPDRPFAADMVIMRKGASGSAIGLKSPRAKQQAKSAVAR